MTTTKHRPRNQAAEPDEDTRCSSCAHLPGCDCPHPCTPRGPENDRTGTTAPAWVRVTGDSPRWELPGIRDNAGILLTPGRLVADAAIAAYGRRHIEQLLAGLPPLPDEAWSGSSQLTAP